MPKIKLDSVIQVEIDDVEKKIHEFQDYLRLNKIVANVTKDGLITLSEEDQDKQHKELTVQIKVMYAVIDWLPLLKKLKEDQESKTETYGDVQIGGMFKKRMNDK